MMVATFLTKEGFQKFQEELDWLVNVRRSEVAFRLSEAEGSDEDDTAEYDAAKDEQGMVEARIKKLEMMLASALILDEQPKQLDCIDVGNYVVVQEEGLEAETYRLVGPAEADPVKGMISFESPLGTALMGRKVGDIVKVKAPDGPFTVKIIS
ncbi:MAG: transcription elongation factor GreA, partial [Anaerolineaceae bacterium]|nr:transcription elongation factor GreA [Anaerolineaceae bacterium]